MPFISPLLVSRDFTRTFSFSATNTARCHLRPPLAWLHASLIPLPDILTKMPTDTEPLVAPRRKDRFGLCPDFLSDRVTAAPFPEPPSPSVSRVRGVLFW